MDTDKVHKKIGWNVIDTYFKDNMYHLVSHHLDSYNTFVSQGIKRIFKENNPIRFIEPKDEHGHKEHRNQCFLYCGGKNGDKIYFENPKNIYPNIARLNNQTYGIDIYYDVDIEYKYYGDDKKEFNKTSTIEKVRLGKFPIMLHSDLCVLKNLPTDIRFNMGECRNDYGGYFVIDGKEKVIVCQEKFADNMMYIRKHKGDNVYSHSCEIRCVSEDSSKPIRYTSVRITHDGKIMVDIPNIKKHMPLFILMRGLGITSDKDIIKHCIWDLDENKDMIDEFLPSILDNNHIYVQDVALKYMMTFTKYSTSVSYLMNVLMNYFLPHIGENNFNDKAKFIGYMVNKLLRVYMGKDKPTDRDNYTYKRIETSGSLLYDLFREYYLLQKRDIATRINTKYSLHIGEYIEHFDSLIELNTEYIFENKIVEDGFRKALKGNWGATAETKRIGVLQELNILSWFSKMSHLRKLNLASNSSAKLVAPHLLHNSQWGKIDPVDTPDGGNIGFHKHMTVMAKITDSYSSFPMINWIKNNTTFRSFRDSDNLYRLTKIFVNGNWIGSLGDPVYDVKWMKLCRQNGIIPYQTSISFDITNNTVYIYTDSGRLCRPVYYVVNKKPSYVFVKEYNWDKLITGLVSKDDYNFLKVYGVDELYPNLKDLKKDEMVKYLKDNRCVVEYVDTAEEEMSLMAMKPSDISKYNTHLEIDPSLTLGILGNSIIFPEHNQFPRDLFSCGQSKQAASIYNTNFNNRFDTSNVVLNNGQIPLIKSRYLQKFNNEEHPYGYNTIVAIMSLNGYNVEDAILANEASVKRGLFRTTYLKTYEVREDVDEESTDEVISVFENVYNKDSTKLKPEYDYSHLDKNGFIKEESELHEKIVLVGKNTYKKDDPTNWKDSSKTAKKGQGGFVDKVYVSNNELGHRTAKIRVRDERVPNIGDKMASRAGQKGTIGLIIPEEDMPFDENGVRPDLIINPHAIPSRMTIGQLIECLYGKVCAGLGGFGDCTAFINEGSGYDTYSKLLTNMGFHGSGYQVMYDGLSGNQLTSSIFIGPTYYMRLKHMVADKINYRAKGPVNALTRQSVHGRANDGGLRIGEMERDSILSHGASYFLNESFLKRGDEYYMAICNHTGSIAIYNKEKDIYISPFVDGPVKFHISNDKKIETIDMHTKYGKSFSIVKIPYAFKLLMLELQAMNVQMRVITDDNVNQMLNISYQSNNINKLLHLSETSENLESEMKLYINNMNDRVLKAKNISTILTKVNSNIMSKSLLSKRNYLFGDLNKSDIENIQMDEVSDFSTTDPHQANQTTELLLKHLDGDHKLTILDGMACIGGNTRSFAKKFKNVIANELDEKRYKMLINNMKNIYGFENIQYFNKDINELIEQLSYDVLFLDPEWGGTGYKKESNILLSIGVTPVEEVVINAFNTNDNLKMIGLKLPLNYNFDHLTNTLDINNLSSTKKSFKNMAIIIIKYKKQIGKGFEESLEKSDLPVFEKKIKREEGDDSELNNMYEHLSDENKQIIDTVDEGLLKELYKQIEGNNPIPASIPPQSPVFKETELIEQSNPKLEILMEKKNDDVSEDKEDESENNDSSGLKSIVVKTE